MLSEKLLDVYACLAIVSFHLWLISFIFQLESLLISINFLLFCFTSCALIRTRIHVDKYGTDAQNRERHRATAERIRQDFHEWLRNEEGIEDPKALHFSDLHSFWETYLYGNNSQRAIELLETIRTLDKDEIEARKQLIILYMLRGEHSKMFEASNEAFKNDGKCLIATEALQFYFKFKKFGERAHGLSLKFWIVSEMRRDTDLKQTLTMAASTANKLKKYQAAINHSKEAIAADPLFHDAWLNLGIAHKGLGEIKEAEKALKTACKLKPSEETRELLDALM